MWLCGFESLQNGYLNPQVDSDLQPFLGNYRDHLLQEKHSSGFAAEEFTSEGVHWRWGGGVDCEGGKEASNLSVVMHNAQSHKDEMDLKY